MRMALVRASASAMFSFLAALLRVASSACDRKSASMLLPFSGIVVATHVARFASISALPSAAASSMVGNWHAVDRNSVKKHCKVF